MSYGIDHLVLGVAELEPGIALVEQLTGVRASRGGRHPGRGTHNALLALGGRRYLEIIAVDPEQPDAAQLQFPALRGLREPQLIAWAVAVTAIADAARAARAAGLEVIGPLAGSRARAKAPLLVWKTLSFVSGPLEGLPFFIEWPPRAAHPSEDAPSGATLQSFTIEHTSPQRLASLLEVLGVSASVASGDRVRLRARLASPRGEVELG
jgi:hypothetical protein